MTEVATVRIVPRRSLLVSALVSILVVLIPVSAVLYWFAIPRAQELWVVLAQGVVVVVSFGLLFRQLSLETVVDGVELRGNGIFTPMVRVPLARIATVDLVPVYVGQSTETALQLLVRDTDGQRIFRLRGNFWNPGDLERVAAALPVAPTDSAHPMSHQEFFAAYPGSAYWFENRPWLTAGFVVVVVAAAIGVAIGVMTLLGMPIMG